MPDLSRFADLDWEDLGACARQKKLALQGQVARVLELRPGFEELDWCAKQHVVYVIDGELRIEFADRVETFPTGEALALGGGEAGRHKAVVEDAAVVLFVVEPAT